MDREWERTSPYLLRFLFHRLHPRKSKHENLDCRFTVPINQETHSHLGVGRKYIKATLKVDEGIDDAIVEIICIRSIVAIEDLVGVSDDYVHLYHSQHLLTQPEF
jgi:hypothetical protein